MVDLDSLKKQVQETVDEKRPLLEKIAKYLYDNPELGSEEYKAFKLLTETLEEHGFTVEKGVYDMPTAFVATYKGNGSGPKVAVLAEYDALPGVGHGCGHNLIASSAIGAGIAASKAIKDLPGEIMVIGTPAEEGHGPSAGSYIGIAPVGTPGHSIKLAEATMTKTGLDALNTGAKALGMTLVELLAKPEILKEAKEFFDSPNYF